MKKNHRRQVELNMIAKEMEASRDEKEPKSLRYVVKIEKPIPRPPTPTIPIPNLVRISSQTNTDLARVVE